MQIELLYFDDCPSWEGALENMKTALALNDMEAKIRLVKVENNDQATRLRFLGSPSFHVNGVDLWPEERKHYNLSCRIYATQQGMKGAPTVEMLRGKLKAVSE